MTLPGKFRIVIVRHGRRSRRWAWSVEHRFPQVGDWELWKSGFAPTLGGAYKRAFWAARGSDDVRSALMDCTDRAARRPRDRQRR